MTERPPPLLPAEVNLRHLKYLHIDVARLLRSRLLKIAKRDPRVGWHSTVLWYSSWHEIPAASIANNDDDLADLAHCSPELWNEIKGEVLRSTRQADGTRTGWILCSDDRWYHTVMVEQALFAWRGHLHIHYERECGRLRKEHYRRTGSKAGAQVPGFDEWLANEHPSSVPFMSRVTAALVPGDNAISPEGRTPMSPGTRTAYPHPVSRGTEAIVPGDLPLGKTRQDKTLLRPPHVPGDNGLSPEGQPPADAADFDRFWTAYEPAPSHRKTVAEKAWAATAKTRPQIAVLLRCVTAYKADIAARANGKFKPNRLNPASWIKEHLWQGYIEGATADNQLSDKRSREIDTMREMWGAAFEPAKSVIPEAEFYAWFRESTPRKRPGGGTIIFTTSKLRAERMEEKYLPALVSIFPGPIEIAFVPEPGAARKAEPEQPQQEPEQPDVEEL